MRKIFEFVIILSLVLIITGCSENEEPVETPILTELYSKRVVNETVSYDIDTDYIKFYEDQNGNVVVGIFDVLTSLDHAISNVIAKEKNLDAFKMSFKTNDVNNLFQTVEYSLVVDAEKDELYISHMDIFQRLNTNGENPYNYKIMVDDYRYEYNGEKIKISLQDYGYDAISFEEDVYLPLSIIDLIFTGENIYLYETLEDIIVLDGFTLRSDVTSNYTPKEKDDIDILSQNMENYLSLYFDLFFGLKDNYVEDSFKDYISGYNISDSENYEELYTKINTFLVDLDDLHSNLIIPGYNNPDYEVITEFEEGTKRAFYYERVNDYQCDLEEEPYTITSDEDTIYIKLNTFNQSIENLINEFTSIRNKDYVQIDLTCNSGGNLYAAYLMVALVTSEIFPVRISDVKAQSISTYYFYLPVTIAKDAEYEIITSYVTYSAANVFVSIINDMGAATITGSNTGGGASPVRFALLPDNTLIITSSNRVILNNKLESIEDGIIID